MDASLFTQIGLGVLVLASFAVAYMASKTALVRHVVLVWFVLATSIVFLFMATKAMNVHRQWQVQATRLEAQLESTLKSNHDLEFGTDPRGLLPGPDVELADTGLRHLRHEMHRLTLDRGPVWFDAQPAQEVAEDGTVAVVVEQPVPHGIAAGVRLFVFEQGPDGQYVGEFEVTESVDGSVVIRPVMNLADWQLQRITQSQPPWALYRSMPVDRHDLFISMNEDELKATIPDESIDEYLRDGQPAADDDPAARTAGYKADGTLAIDEEQDQVVEVRYVRQLRDYGWLLRDYAQQRTLMEVQRDALDADAARLSDALAKSQQDVVYRQTEQANLGEDLEKFQVERQAITEHLARLEQQYAILQARLIEVLDQNVQRAAEFTSLKLEAARRIDALTASGT